MKYKSAIHDGLGMAVGISMGMFYADYSLIRLWDQYWLQGDLNLLIRLIQRVGLMDNIKKYKTTTFQLWAIHTGM